jgi:hypothetical protein
VVVSPASTLGGVSHSNIECLEGRRDALIEDPLSDEIDTPSRDAANHHDHCRWHQM